MDKNLVTDINDVFSPKSRLGIMTILLQKKEVDFSTLKSILSLTDGNLGAHLKVLEKKGYIGFEKKFVNRRPKTIYHITQEGHEAFLKHLTQLESIINMISEQS